jgi:hypothetical protein
MHLGKAVLAAIVIICGATPALADVKAGVDAWARGDYRKAVAEWRGPAVAGDPDAQFNLGQAYKLGRGVPVDLALAEEWYRKSAQQGHPQGEDNYGLSLFQNQKRDRALPWLEKSSARGEPRAQFVLGTMYFNGDSVQRDWVKAYALMTRASSSGLPQATSTLAQMDRYIGLKERQQGTLLARRYEEDAQRPRLPVEFTGLEPRSARPIAEVDLRRSSADRAGAGRPDYGGERGPDRPVATAEVAPWAALRNDPEGSRTPPPRRARAARAPAKVVERPAPRAAVGGSWRVQLGAFRDPAGARRMWSDLGGRFPGRQPYYVKSGALTRLLVGPFVSQAAASGACGSVKPCMPTR